MRADIQGLTIDDILDEIALFGEKKYRAKQIFQWVQEKAVYNFDEMTNLSKDLRNNLVKYFDFFPLTIKRKLQSKLDDTTKCLLELEDKETIETVRMSYIRKDTRNRHTVCVSTQVGCPMGCKFCATGIAGWKRNLTVAEIVGQVLAMQRDLVVIKPDEKITNVVFMGMGEPLLNYDNVIKAIKILNSPFGMNIGMRKISISTCGLVPQIKKLAKENLPITLSVSLHAPNNSLRSEMMPVNDRFPVEELIDTCKYYIDKTGRRVTFEYTLIAGKNDSFIYAKQLAKLIKGMIANVNIIPLNTVEETGLKRPVKERTLDFIHNLEKMGITALLREEKGSDIDAACGQLRGKEGI